MKHFTWLLCCAPLPETPDEAAKRKRKEREKAKKQKEKDAQKAEALNAKEEKAGQAKEEKKSSLTPENLLGRLQGLSDRTVVRLGGTAGGGNVTVAQSHADRIRQWTPPPDLQTVLMNQAPSPRGASPVDGW